MVEAFCAAVGDAYRFVNNPANTDVVVGVVAKTLKIDQPTAASFRALARGIRHSDSALDAMDGQVRDRSKHPARAVTR